MKKIKDAILRHKGLAIVVLLTLILFIVMLVLFISMFFGGSSSKYGHRLDGIEDVKLDDNRLDEIDSKIEEYEEVEESNTRIQGKIVYFNIDFVDDCSVDKAKEIASSTLEEFSEEEIKYYDFSYFLVQEIESDEEENEEEEEEKGFVITGNKHPKVDNIGWIQS